MPILTFLFESHIFLVAIHFSKEHHSLESLSHSLEAQNICKTLFMNVIIMGEI
jgi:hypothetical protein